MLATSVFGLQYVLYGKLMRGFPPAPDFLPAGHLLALVLGILMLAGGIAAAANILIGAISLSLAALFFLCFLLHCTHLSAVLVNGVARTGAFEPLALCGGYFALSSLTLAHSSPSRRRSFAVFGLALFSLSMVVFGVQHFEFAAFVATLVPAWIPLHLFWAYATGTALIFGGIALWLPALRASAALGLGLMFLLWFLLLHLPRAVSNPHHGDEWSSAFIALGIAAAACIIASPGPTTSGSAGGSG